MSEARYETSDVKTRKEELKVNAATGARGLDRDGAEWRFGTYIPFAAQSCAPSWPACRHSAPGGVRTFDMRPEMTTLKEE